MPLLTNQLLEKLTNALDAFTAASTMATDLGIPMTANIPFYRMGEPVRLYATPSSGAIRFPDTGNLQLPPNVTSFMVSNINPFPIRLKGTRDGRPFNVVTPESGWIFMPGQSGPYTTVNPIALSVISIDGPFAASDPTQKAGSGWLELQYGVGM